MARARNIKPGFFRNADLVELSMEARLLFIGLWTLADRMGRLEDRPKQIKMEIFPADNVDCDALLDDIAVTGMLARYQVDGKRYLQVVNFTKHQNPHRDEKASTIPEPGCDIPQNDETPDKHGASTVQAPCKEDAGTVPIRLNPESGSLIADSLIPDSPTQDSAHMTQLAGAACMAIKKAGVSAVNPSHPKLISLIDKGISAQQFADAAAIAVERGKGFGYVLGIVEGQIADALAPIKTRANTEPGETFRERDDRLARERIEAICPSIAAKAPRSRNVIDITPMAQNTFGALT